MITKTATMSRKNDHIYQHISSVWDRISGRPNTRQLLVDEVQSFITEKGSGQQSNEGDIAHKIGFLYQTYKTYDFKDHQLVLLVSNYVKQALKIDHISQHGPGGTPAYMKLMRGDR